MKRCFNSLETRDCIKNNSSYHFIPIWLAKFWKVVISTASEGCGDKCTFVPACSSDCNSHLKNHLVFVREMKYVLCCPAIPRLGVCLKQWPWACMEQIQVCLSCHCWGERELTAAWVSLVVIRTVHRYSNFLFPWPRGGPELPCRVR